MEDVLEGFRHDAWSADEKSRHASHKDDTISDQNSSTCLGNQIEEVLGTNARVFKNQCPDTEASSHGEYSGA